MALDQTRITEKAPEIYPELRKKERRLAFGEVNSNGEMLLKEAGLSSIPHHLFNEQWEDVQHLDLRENLLTNIDSLPINKLKNLLSLDLRGNTLDILTESIGDLINLNALRLDNNSISALPITIKKLVNLEILSISGNNLSFLPSGITELKNLQTLIVSENKIKYLPSTLGELNNLRVLHLHKNNFSQLPLTFYVLENIKELSLEWLRYTSPPLPKLLKGHIGEAMIMSLKTLCCNLYSNKHEECTLITFLQHFSEGEFNINQIDNKKRSLLHTAAIEGDYGVVHGLIKSNIDIDMIDKDGLSAMSLAIKSEQMECAKILMESGADVNEGGGALGSSLHLAAFLVQPWLVRELLKRRADVNLRDCEGNTPLHIILGVFNKNKFASQMIADILIEAGAQVNALNKESWAPIHLAARRGQSFSIKWALRQNKVLKKAGRETIDFNLQGGSHYWTPMHLAGHAGHFEIVELLVNSGSHLFIRNSDGRTPRQSSKGDLALFKYLIRAEKEILKKQVQGRVDYNEIDEKYQKDDSANEVVGDSLWQKYAAVYNLAKKGMVKELKSIVNELEDNVVKRDLVYLLIRFGIDVKEFVKNSSFDVKQEADLAKGAKEEFVIKSFN
jgi:Leucine-rich repeat (LRR) protein/ankyrin repeat protein